MGCAARPLSEVARDLGDLDADVRASAAETLEDAARDKKDLPNDVVEALLYRAAVETDLETRASIARALGETGDARAKEVLDAYARTDDPEQREVASIALQTWSIRSGRVKPGHVFAADWPYGTEAYPPKLAAKK
ncbi:MAG: HEAT repeat domain-containing protein [Polyangiaceae bacterium]|nr:HEAT repeat domain-containing protein [Polyangiaceae bacterium]